MDAAWPSAWSDREILALRGPKNSVDPHTPYAYLVEPEHTAAGCVEDVATIFLANRECPFRCLMCDLWRNTTDVRVPDGAISRQVAYALDRLPPAQHVKLYNSGNFFDAQAIPPIEHAEIAERVSGFHTVIVENHPRLCGDPCLRFRDRLAPDLEVALGLETVHPQVLARLNKQMTLADFQRAVEFLLNHGIAVRTFILLRPPYLNEDEGVAWALKSVEFATELGIGCCSIVPTRAGNGAMERLAAQGLFAPPSLASMETVLEQSFSIAQGRVFIDLWDIERFFDCAHCGPARAARLREMNLTQRVLPPVVCPSHQGPP